MHLSNLPLDTIPLSYQPNIWVVHMVPGGRLIKIVKDRVIKGSPGVKYHSMIQHWHYSSKMGLTPSSFPEYARLYPMSKSAKARTAKSLSTLSSLPSQACATWPRLYRWKHKNHTFLTHRYFFIVTNLYKDSPALFPVDNDVRDTGGYQTIDSPAGSDQGVMVDKEVTKGSGQHLDFCWKKFLTNFIASPQGCR